MMADISIQLVGPSNEPLGRLQLGALAIVAEAEQTAFTRNLAKRTALPIVLREHLACAGYNVKDEELAAAIQALEAVRSGKRLADIPITVYAQDNGSDAGLSGGNHAKKSLRSPGFMAAAQNQSHVVKFFELERVYPDKVAQSLYERLVGIDDQKERLLIELEMLLYPDRLEAWSRRNHHGRVLRLCELQRNRAPLILLEGDVGTGKTALAETVGDALARRIGDNKRVHLLKINTQVRGTGQVGEMSDLIVQAFTRAETHAASLQGEPVLLLLDEADALAASRNNQQMHHEDKAGLNTLLQRLDNLRLTRVTIAVIFITNRPEALDPAIRRRAALNLVFERPGGKVRAEIITSSVPELKLTPQQIAELVSLTGEHASKNNGVPFTASDLTDRLLPGALREAYSQRRGLRVDDLLNQAGELKPTPRISSSG